MKIVACIHTEGVVLSNRYYALEIAYQDVTGKRHLFFAKSPISYHNALKKYPHINKSLEVIMNRKSHYNGYRAYAFKEVVSFLQSRYETLRKIYGIQSVFAYKGKSYQRDTLDKANIPSVNLEIFSYPPISKLQEIFYYVKRKPCPFHISLKNKCAFHVLNLINAYSQ